MYHYPLAIEQGTEEESIGVTVPDLPGCFSAGETLQEAIEQAHEAIKFHLEGLAQEGELPPFPSTIDLAKSTGNFDGYIWAIASIDPSPYMGRSIKLNVSLPTLLDIKIKDFLKEHPDFKGRSELLQQGAIELMRKYTQ